MHRTEEHLTHPWLSLKKTWRAWLMAVRLRTFPIPIIPVLVGTGLAYASGEAIEGQLFACVLGVALFVTIGTNLINDVIDFEKGGDPLKRIGHLKVIRAGLLSKGQIFAGGIGAFSLAIAFGVPLALQVGGVMLFLVLLSVLCGYCYTGGPYPICYLGMSELFIFVFYGGVCVITAFYVQTGMVTREALLCAVQMGCLAILPNALNNFRDMGEDEKVHRQTLAVRFGKSFARWEIAVLTIVPFVAGLAWLGLGYWGAAALPFLLLPLAFLFVRSIWITDPGPVFNRYFGLSVLVQFLFGILLIVGLLL